MILLNIFLYRFDEIRIVGRYKYVILGIMDKQETLIHYYQTTNRELPFDLLRSNGTTSHFNVLKRDHCSVSIPFNRKDYYKICLTTGHAVLNTENGNLDVNQPALFFSNPSLKFGWENVSEQQGGYVCLFNEQYLCTELKRELDTLYASFQNSLYPFILLNQTQFDAYLHYFQLMHTEYHQDFEHKNKMIETALKLIIYSSIKIQSDACPPVKTAQPNRLVNRFLDLLDNQFLLDAPGTALSLKTPADFAKQLYVHVNHLNSSVKNYTGKPTSKIIQEKIIKEAKNLLRYTNWGIAEISYSLGFEHPQNFNNFFKKQVGESPRSFKSAL